jgi:hypothetical protein
MIQIVGTVLDTPLAGGCRLSMMLLLFMFERHPTVPIVPPGYDLGTVVSRTIVCGFLRIAGVVSVAALVTVVGVLGLFWVVNIIGLIGVVGVVGLISVVGVAGLTDVVDAAELIGVVAIIGIMAALDAVGSTGEVLSMAASTAGLLLTILAGCETGT